MFIHLKPRNSTFVIIKRSSYSSKNAYSILKFIFTLKLIVYFHKEIIANRKYKKQKRNFGVKQGVSVHKHCEKKLK